MACCALFLVGLVAMAVGAIWLGWVNLKDLPWPSGTEAFPGADRMVRISLEASDAAPGEVARWFAGQAVLESVVPWRAAAVTLPLGEGSERLFEGAEVPLEFFQAVEVQPLLGRSLVPGDFARGDVIVIGYGLWQNGLGGDAAVVGSTLALGVAGEVSEEEVIVLGVMPEGFAFPNGSQLWRPLDQEREGGVEIFGNLRPGTTVEMAQAELERVLARNLPDDSALAAGLLRVEPFFGD